MRSETSASPAISYQMIIWVPVCVLAFIIFYHEWAQLDGIHLLRSRLIIGRDFLNVWTGGNLALSGETDILYDYHGYMAWQKRLFGPLDPYNYSYPPFSLFLAMPFALLPYPVALTMWTVMGAAFFLWAAKPFMPRNLPIIVAVLTPAALVNIWVGHYGFVMGGLWLLFFSLRDRHPRISGVIAGLMTVKPHLGILIALSMVVRRHYAAIIIACAVLLSLILSSSLIFRADLWRSWIVDTSSLQAKIMTAPGPKFYYVMMPSLFIAMREFPISISAVAQMASVGCAIALFWRARHALSEDLAFITASATALILPYIFNYDLTVASLGFVILLYRQWNDLHRAEKCALWLGFAAPMLTMAYSYIGAAGILAGLVVQVRHARMSRD